MTAEPPVGAAPPAAGAWRKYAITAGFLAPAALFLVVWVVYPAIRTVIRSFYDREGSSFVGFDNYQRMFTDDTLVTAIKNSAVWVLVVPVLVTAIGLVFAVMTERVRFAVAFKTVVFMPLAISAFAAGVLWRIMYIQDPDQGTINAAISSAKEAVAPGGVLTQAQPSTPEITGSTTAGFELATPVEPGGVAPLGLTGIPPDEVPADAEQAVRPEALQGGITGVVWRDFKPGGGTPGEVESDEVGIPGVTVELRNAQGSVTAKATTEANGAFAFEDVAAGEYRVAVGKDTFKQPFGGVSWLGPKLITPSIIMAYLWIWAGFSMVVIAAGLAAIPRDVLEAARTDGANEWQVFRRVTAPLLAPVLTVVFITMLINVIKVFDIVLAIAPGAVVDDANVIAVAMWRTAFGGVNDFGLGSAVAVFLFVLVIPVLLLNIRRFKREE